MVLAEEVKPDAIRDLISRMRDLMDEAPEDWIQLNIMSPGGQISTGFGLYDFVQANKLKLQTVVLGHAHSMAVPLFLAGTRRIVARRAIMLLHEVGYVFEQKERLDLTQIRRRYRLLEHQQKEYIEVLVERTGGKLNAAQALKLMETDTILTATQAVRYGIAHEILP
ncbi:MAG: hypothetical protein A3B30_03960 [Candidatus Komeilibacteria bacterium RIFCSPLOWO2_01_FULL_52_15]|uniref:ATP-dependent Clp protease proteolytic subunit n=2 Tax=Candidatus Komeiliibacteriota TaxID=1817908 RepID=A0A1G2BQC8_9BACT|nr:MAG: hypothetical protein A2677_00660 [Candidatus Komeilibacteria bacterium RIFCSPHIGHO2_01_FULL_52_14]OGY91318.1 MAG: hypothetical protein A3B30_03960 [Candidatus Komeilibacteria bacterium RIFCSPLOWO2_01_FULL_52_15]